MIDKDRVAEILVEIGTLLELKGENPFKTRAYANAARALEGLAEPPETVVAEERLGDIKGIGEGLQKKTGERVSTGRLPCDDELKKADEPVVATPRKRVAAGRRTGRAYGIPNRKGQVKDTADIDPATWLVIEAL